MATAHSNDNFEALNQLGETANSRRETRSRTRGLPNAAARFELAETYLKVQHRLWHSLVSNGVLPPRSDDATRAMAESFRVTFEDDRWMKFDDPRGKKLLESLGAAYLRYSDDNSNPRSLDQQLASAVKHGLSIMI